MVKLQLILLSVFIPASVSRDVFGQVGDSVQLDVENRKLVTDDLTWKFNENNLLKFYYSKNNTKMYDFFKDRLEFNKATYSLTLKNLKKTDNGQFQVKVSGAQDTIIAEYRLTVLDHVETPALTYEQSKETCNTTVSCRGQGLSINSSCTQKTCENEEASSGNIMLTLAMSNGFIICNQSNPVSWKEANIDMKIIENCGGGGKTNASSRSCPYVLWPVLSATITIIQLILGII